MSGVLLVGVLTAPASLPSLHVHDFISYWLLLKESYSIALKSYLIKTVIKNLLQRIN